MKKIILLFGLIAILFARTFTVSYDPDYAPFTYQNDEHINGLLIDIWKLWAKKNGYKIKFVNGRTWENAINLAKTGEVDFFIGTNPYESWMMASKPFFHVKTGMFVRENYSKKISKIGIIGLDYEDDILKFYKSDKYKKYFGNNIEINSYKTYEELFQALKNKKVDAIYDDYLALVYFAIKHQYMFTKPIENMFVSSPVQAISNNKKKIEIFNDGLKNVTQKELNEIYKKWDITKEVNYQKYVKYIALFIIVVMAIILIVITINFRLNNLVKEKTKKLELLNKNLEKEIKKRTRDLEIKSKEAEKSARAKSRFLANMSHEIRTPLNAIIGFTSLLQNEELTPSAKRYVDIIEESSKNLLGVINDILDFSKIEEGKLSIDKVPFNLDNEVNNIAQMFYAKADEKNIIFKINKENTKVDIVTDPMRFRQIVLNLLSNAFKFTDEYKTIELNVKYDNQRVFVSVKDEGIGISPDKLDHIFEDFTQADDSTTRKYGGTGLGLSISSSLVKLLGGELKVKSEINKGSEFYFDIPAKKAEKKEQKDIQTLKYDFNYNILLAEDNKANQMFMQVILKKLGCTFDIANDGKEAVELYKNNYDKYDLILMDENMPNMTGSMATKEIRVFENENNIKHVYIVALTANALTGDKEKFMKVGMNDYLSKPLNVEKLISIFRKMV